MIGDPGRNPLPSGPSLCFNKDEFMKANFSVDVFVNECRKRVPLETLRDDLSIYLKVLQTAMIELINKDYADFVHLSANLVGLDKAINNLSVPLGQLKEEVLSVKTVMDEAIEAVQVKLKRRLEIQEQKASIQRLMNIVHSVKKMEKLLNIQISGERETSQMELTGQMIERVATEFNHLQFYLAKNQGQPLEGKIRLRILHITTTLEQNLERSLREGLEREDIEILRQCLRTYATIDKIKDAENLFRMHTVRPYMEQIITEYFLRQHHNDLKIMYDKILEFIPKHCKGLKEITSGTLQSVEIIRGYDFFVNAVWPEITSCIESRVPSIFSPGNPDIFHKKYCASLEFINKFERQCSSQASVKRLREHPSYNGFLSRWNLVVYFQIRFQEIAGAFEKVLLGTSFNKSADESIFKLLCTYMLWTCLTTCWSDSIYIPSLCHRFWKLNIQLLSRFTTWIADLQQKELSRKEETSTETTDVTIGKNVTEGRIYPPITLSQIVSLVSDCEILLLKLPGFFLDQVKLRLKVTGFDQFSILEESLSESINSIAEQLPHFSTHIVDEITLQCSVHLKLVTDIPRLYRRTNKEIPSKASNYVTNLIKPILMFIEEHKATISPERKQQWSQSIVQNITEQYLAITSDVLTSVKKMEDSLKRLKKARDKPSLSASGVNTGMSDDDKIRLQLALDIEHFGQQIELLGISKDDIRSYPPLVEMVETARSTLS